MGNAGARHAKHPKRHLGGRQKPPPRTRQRQIPNTARAGAGRGRIETKNNNKRMPHRAKYCIFISFTGLAGSRQQTHGFFFTKRAPRATSQSDRALQFFTIFGSTPRLAELATKSRWVRRQRRTTPTATSAGERRREDFKRQREFLGGFHAVDDQEGPKFLGSARPRSNLRFRRACRVRVAFSASLSFALVVAALFPQECFLLDRDGNAFCRRLALLVSVRRRFERHRPPPLSPLHKPPSPGPEPFSLPNSPDLQER